MKQRKSKQVRLFSGNAHRNCDDCCFGKDCLSESLLSIPKWSSHIQKMTLLSLEIMK